MTTLRKPMGLALSIVTAACAAWMVGQSCPASAAMQGGGKSVLLVLPIDVTNAGGANADEVSGVATDVVASRLIASGAYSVTTYFKQLPPVARLHNEQRLSDSDVSAPFAEDNTKAIKIGKLAGYERVAVGSVDDYQFDSAAGQVTTTVSVRLLEAATGKVLKSVTKTLASSKGGRAKEGEKAVEAVRTTVEAIMSQIAPAQAAPAATWKPTHVAPKRGKKQAWLWGLLSVGLGVGIGLSTHKR